MQDQNTFVSLLEFLENPRLYELYPTKVSELIENLFWIGADPKERFLKTAVSTVRSIPIGKVVSDLWKARKL
jgi:hypothetical protein